MGKIIITNNTDLPMKTIVEATSGLYKYPINVDEIITYEDGKYYCYIKGNKESINFIFGIRG